MPFHPKIMKSTGKSGWGLVTSPVRISQQSPDVPESVGAIYQCQRRIAPSEILLRRWSVTRVRLILIVV